MAPPLMAALIALLQGVPPALPSSFTVNVTELTLGATKDPLFEAYTWLHDPLGRREAKVWTRPAPAKSVFVLALPSYDQRLQISATSPVELTPTRHAVR